MRKMGKLERIGLVEVGRGRVGGKSSQKEYLCLFIEMLMRDSEA